jgi:hypothetical protein
MSKMGDQIRVGFTSLIQEAQFKGDEAAKRKSPTPMYVMDSDSGRVIEQVNDGVCGFAWVNIKPGTSRLAKWMVKEGYARKDSYYGGVTVWIHDFNQSMEKKEAYATAYARALCEAGYAAMPMSRMD